jgi:MEMO1 family protein
MYSEETRTPAVAGRFYTAVPQRLRSEIESYIDSPAAARAKAYGVMVPHAGYMYSGAVCGRALASVEIAPVCLVLHTKHHLGGGPMSLAQFTKWDTPLGTVPVDDPLNDALAKVPGIEATNLPHFSEHAAEVVIPFLQVLRPDVRVAVVAVSNLSPEQAAESGVGVARAILGHSSDVLIVSSSDMNHYADEETTQVKDKLALDKLAAFDAPGLIEVCEHHDITMCGVGATALMIEACKELGATRVELLEHTTSGQVSGDYNQVVGYASARVL